MTPERVRTPRRSWLAFTMIAALVAVMNALGVVVLLINARWIDSLLGALSVVTAYWFAMGAWRRTPWGLATIENAPPMPALLSDRHARAYVFAALGCAGLALVALGLQALFVANR